MMKEGQPLTRSEIEDVLPHRKPFLFLKSAEVIESGKHAVGQLADLSDPQFDYLKGHFPGFAIVPGAIIMETLAELAGIAMASGIDNLDNKIGVLIGDSMKYKQMILPGDSVELEAVIKASRMNFFRSAVKAVKDGKIAAEGEITFALIDKQPWLKHS